MGCFLYREPDSVCQAYMCKPNVLYWIHGCGLCALICFTLNVASPCFPHPIPPEAYLITPFCVWFSLGRSFGLVKTSTVAHTIG